MQRELKFRAWSPKFGGMIYPGGEHRIGIDADGYCHSVWLDARDDEGVAIMQFTGLKDRNGVEIFEGDVIEFDAKEWGSDTANRWPVQWDNENGCWDLGGGGSHKADGQFRTVIGNIYEGITATAS